MRLDHNPCDICIEEQCEGKKTCHCETCKNLSVCNKFLRATIRITRKCTQQCQHCCFSCSPTATDMMSIDMAKKVADFCKRHFIYDLNVMGGEFWLNPDYETILRILTDNSGCSTIRLVSNGDWAEHNPSVTSFLKNLPNLIVSISKDKYHTNQNVDNAANLLLEAGIPHNIATAEQGSDDAIVPIGNALYDYNFFSVFGTYCSNPHHKYTIMINEQGGICKCPFGIWEFADIDDFLQDSTTFLAKFKNINQLFHKKCFVPNCKQCIRYHDQEDK